MSGSERSRSFRTESDGSGSEGVSSSWSLLSEREANDHGSSGPVEPIAIIGMSCRLGGNATDTSSLWDMLVSGRTAWTPGPGKRFNMKAFQDPISHRSGTTNTGGGHFLKEDVAAFDAGFFGINPMEAMAMDPQHRLLLEIAYECFQNAGLTSDSLWGSNTGVYVGQWSTDYHEIQARDVDSPPLYLVTGTGPAIVSNRVSYTFNLRGPSFTVDTGCSSSLVALHQAVQSLRAGETKQCFVGGVNLLLDPQRFVYQSRLKMFSREGRSFAFDARANGYGRGEGCTGVLLKPLAAALRDGDHIRAVIRNSVLNQDGRTPGISVPSALAQKEAIRRAYRQAKLALRADYVEAHGTGTKVGDPIEAHAISQAFTEGGMRGCRLPIGSIKANVGHTEGAAGLAGLIKAVLMLEHGVIPPQANYETPNPDILLDKWRLRIPTKLESQELRRISVNSFGYGGTNAHVVVDSAAYVFDFSSRLRHTSGLRPLPPTPKMPRLFFVSTASEKSCQRICRRLAKYLVIAHRRSPYPDAILARLAYTLNRQSMHPFRLALVATTMDDLIKQLVAAASLPSIPRRGQGDKARIAFVFSGQGAQYAEMGRELLGSHPPFLRSLERARQLLLRLGCQWDLLSELCRPKSESRINNPAVSQPASTAVQLALVDLLSEFGIMPDAVVGHSSGEIAAAYACGAITFERAMTASYFRGKLTNGLISGKTENAGAMLAVGADPEHVRKHIDSVGEERGRVRIACFNSPSSVTVSGDAPAIDELKAVLDADGTFNRKLMTNGAAYHSHQMQIIAEEYASSLKGVTSACLTPSVRMFSSVTGKEVDAETNLDGQYWAQNLVSPVLFSQALAKLCDQEYRGEAINTIVEVGPHSQLGGPVNQILKAVNKSQINYASTLKRGKPADISFLECMGFLHTQTASISLHNLNRDSKDGVSPGLLVDLPPYPFDHDRSFWHETRISKDYRYRKHVPHNLLGTLSPDVNRLEPRWRRFLSLRELPWLRGHMVQGQVLFPAAGYLTMAVQAALQHAHMTNPNTLVESVLFRNISIGKGLVLPEDGPDIELQLSLRPEARTARESSRVWSEFRIFTVSPDGRWTEHCRGAIQAETEPVSREDAAPGVEELARIEARCTHETAPKKFYHLSRRAGLDYQGAFENVVSFRANSDTAVIVAREPESEMTPGGMGDFLHPAVLDSSLFHGLCSIMFVEHGLKSAHVPTFIQQLRVFSRTSRVGAELVTTSNCTGEGTVFDVTVCENGSDKNDLVLAAHGVRTTALPSNEVLDGGDEEMCHSIDWVTYVDAWTTEHRDHVCRSVIAEGSAATVNDYLDAVTLHYVAKAVKDVGPADIPQGYRQHLFAWMQLATESLSELPALPEPPAGVDAGAFGEAVHRLGTHLPEILTAKTEPLALLTPDNLLTRIYQVERSDRCVAQMAEYCHQLGRQKAGLRILEVGAGTASATVPILEALAGRGHRYVEKYYFTDLSPAFFEAAKERLGELAEVVEFKALDVEHGAKGQGFEEGAFDIIIASNVVHACPSIDGVLGNLRPLLKPGGRLMLMELTRDTAHYNLLFGVFEGWWAGFGEGRRLSPLLTPSVWTSRLQGAGFCETEPVFCDYAEEDGGSLSVFVARKPLEATPQELPPMHLIVENAGRAVDIQSQVESIQSRVPGSHIITQSLSGTSPGANIAVIMPEVASLLTKSTEPNIWEDFKHWALNTRVLILVGSAFDSSAASEESTTAIWPGFVRCLRRERPDIRLITLDIHAPFERIPSKLTESLSILLQSPSLDLSLAEEEVENEFMEKDGQLFVSRAFHRPELSQYVRASRGRAEPQLVPFLDPGRVLTAELATPGLMETLRWKDDDGAPSVGPDDIRFELRAASVNFKDVLIAAGQLDGITEMRNDCSGVVLEVGENMRARFKEGDRVCALYSRSYTNYPVVPGDCCAVVPDGISFEEAAALPIVWCTAYHALVDKARLSKGETVLIHSAAGAVGQAAIILAQHLGAEIFVTVSSDAKRDFLHERYEVPRDHMFSSRDTTFHGGIKRLTKGRGVDVVLNSLSGEMFRQSCNLMAPFGRFVEIGRKDLMDDALMPMGFLLRNVTLSYVELSLIISDCKSLARRILEDVVSLAASGVIRSVSIQTMPLSRIEDAFRLIQAGKHMGKIVLRVEEGQNVKATPPTPTPAQLREDATYAIVGGFGGLGRSIISWMADHGAKYILCLSRSGPTGDGLRFIEEMDGRGVTVVAPKCDVASLEQVSRLVAETEQQGLPPIRGIIQSAMVIKDSVFEDMTQSQWHAALAPKLAGTHNLHTTLTNLDFFITLSSIVALRGNLGQANYAAACSYQDAFARYRASLGLPSSSINVGPVLEAGFVSENPEVEAALRHQGMGTISVGDLLALLNHAVANPVSEKPEDSVCAIGMLAGVRGGAGENTNTGWNLFSHVLRRDAAHGQKKEDGPPDAARLLSEATNLADVVEVVCGALLQQLSKLIATPVEALSAGQSLDSYGVDSLVAVELRNWIGAHLQANVQLMVLRGTGSILELAGIVAKESRLVSCADK